MSLGLGSLLQTGAMDKSDLLDVWKWMENIEENEWGTGGYKA